MSKSDFESTNGFIIKNAYNLMYNTPLYHQNLQRLSWHQSGTLPDF